METVLFSEQIAVERKSFAIELRENPRGRFLKIVEDVGGRRDTVIIPEPGLPEVRAIIDRALEAGRRTGGEGHGNGGTD